MHVETSRKIVTADFSKTVHYTITRGITIRMNRTSHAYVFDDAL
jgi:hypothetical protein